jgi:hypothetical protein
MADNSFNFILLSVFARAANGSNVQIDLMNVVFIFSILFVRSNEAFQGSRPIPVYEGKRPFIHTPRRKAGEKRRQRRRRIPGRSFAREGLVYRTLELALAYITSAAWKRTLLG